ncbi:MAG: ribosomal-processing cysteine protease Prp [Lachnospiraceae bacterium]|nr:ribosomal-processing cysteine protease Prp [Lachnospiraceae bacterium]
MTTVTFFKRADVYTGFIAKGHAGFDERGKDIVCSSVSILVINTINSIEEICHVGFGLTKDDKKGILGIELNDTEDAGTQLLIRSLMLGLESIRDEYGKKYLKVITKEVNDNVKA